ncbi:MAG: hypothetical protein KAT68_15700 [Bacteroidales bacterium]|nr:hypothetical protein [Bacteroidales bacterium]
MKKDFNILTIPEKDTTQVVIEGNLVLKNAEKIKNQLLILKQNETILEIIIRNVSDMDLSFLQILLSLIKTLKSKATITMSLSDEYKLLIYHAGFFELINNDINKIMVE